MGAYGSLFSWKSFIQRVLEMPPHQEVIIPKRLIEHPLLEGALKTSGEPRGQIADFEFILNDGRRVHVVEYNDRYHVHWDYVSPLIDPINHLRYDAPHWWVALTTIGCGLLDYYLNDKSEEALVRGTLLGLTLGMLTLPRG